MGKLNFFFILTKGDYCFCFLYDESITIWIGYDANTNATISLQYYAQIIC